MKYSPNEINLMALQPPRKIISGKDSKGIKMLSAFTILLYFLKQKKGGGVQPFLSVLIVINHIQFSNSSKVSIYELCFY